MFAWYSYLYPRNNLPGPLLAGALDLSRYGSELNAPDEVLTGRLGSISTRRKSL